MGESPAESLALWDAVLSHEGTAFFNGSTPTLWKVSPRSELGLSKPIIIAQQGLGAHRSAKTRSRGVPHRAVKAVPQQQDRQSRLGAACTDGESEHTVTGRPYKPDRKRRCQKEGNMYDFNAWPLRGRARVKKFKKMYSSCTPPGKTNSKVISCTRGLDRTSQCTGPGAR